MDEQGSVTCVKKFHSFEFIKTHEKESRSFLPQYTKVEEELCMISALREYQAVEPSERIKEQIDLMAKYGYIKTDISIDTMIDYRFLPEELKKQGQNPNLKTDSGGLHGEPTRTSSRTWV